MVRCESIIWPASLSKGSRASGLIPKIHRGTSPPNGRKVDRNGFGSWRLSCPVLLSIKTNGRTKWHFFQYGSESLFFRQVLKPFQNLVCGPNTVIGSNYSDDQIIHHIRHPSRSGCQQHVRYHAAIMGRLPFFRYTARCVSDIQIHQSTGPDDRKHMDIISLYNISETWILKNGLLYELLENHRQNTHPEPSNITA